MIYIMSDIHGNLSNYISIMNQINLGKEDDLYVLGDVIDRHPYGITILREIMSMKNAHMVLGNHEWMMLKAMGKPYGDPDRKPYTLKDARKQWYSNWGRVTDASFRHLSENEKMDIIEYLQSLPISIDVTVNERQFHLVHAAPEDLFEEFGREHDSIVSYSIWDRDWLNFIPSSENITIFGHTPTAMLNPKVNPLQIWNYNNSVIGIDCGSGFPVAISPNMYTGRLSCIRLNDMKDYYSK